MYWSCDPPSGKLCPIIYCTFSAGSGKNTNSNKYLRRKVQFNTIHKLSIKCLEQVFQDCCNFGGNLLILWKNEKSYSWVGFTFTWLKRRNNRSIKEYDSVLNWKNIPYGIREKNTIIKERNTYCRIQNFWQNSF